MLRALLVPVVLILAFLKGLPYRAIVGGAPVAPNAIAIDGDTVVGSGHFLHDFPADNPDGSVNALVEIPSGTTGKFDVGDDGRLRWARDRNHGGRREVDYLPFPVNYGMVPRTLSTDGDALDIIVLGRGFERARITHVRVIGVLAMADESGRDDKLVTVPIEADLQNGFSRLHDLAELDEHYPELRNIIELWFSNYWGAGATEVLGWGDAFEARQILDDAKLKYEEGPTGSGRIARHCAEDPRLRVRVPSDAPVRSLRPPLHPTGCGSAC